MLDIALGTNTPVSLSAEGEREVRPYSFESLVEQ